MGGHIGSAPTVEKILPFLYSLSSENFAVTLTKGKG